MLEIEIRHGDLTAIKVDAIVNPANSLGVMGGGVAGVIKRIGGEMIEQEARRQAPIPVGGAVATMAGSLPCRYVIHVPTMEQPAQPTEARIVAQATRAALEHAERLQLASIAIPGMGTGVGRVPVKEAAEAIIETIRRFPAKSLKRVILVDVQPDMVRAFQEALKESPKSQSPK
jgi:O-acetyl-ADP-ribose deacetylase (regulator of RNase III)